MQLFPIDIVRGALKNTSDEDIELYPAVLKASEYSSYKELKEAMLQARWFSYSEEGWYKTPDIRGAFKEVPTKVAMNRISQGILVDEAHLGPVLLVFWKNLHKARTSMFVKVQNEKVVDIRFGEPVKHTEVSSNWLSSKNLSIVGLEEALENGVSKVMCLGGGCKGPVPVVGKNNKGENKEWKLEKSLKGLWKVLLGKTCR